MSNFTRIRLTIQTLRDCYSHQNLSKELILVCLFDIDFQCKYVGL
jgi:hypothetical protein